MLRVGIESAITTKRSVVKSVKKTKGDEVGHKRDQCPKKRDASKSFVFSVASDGYMKNMWLLDCGASFHMTNDRDDFCTLQSVQDGLEVYVASGDRLPVRGTGSVNLVLESGGAAIVNNVLFIPDLDHKLLSICVGACSA